MYPEHDRLNAIKGESQTIGTFLDWLRNERKPTLVLAEYLDDWDRPVPSNVTIEGLLAEYFEINCERIAAEKDAMLARLQNDRRDAR